MPVNFENVISEYPKVVIPPTLEKGIYATIESDGSIVIRNLKEESKMFEDQYAYYDHDFTDYPFESGVILTYMEMYKWRDSAEYKCDYEQRGCHIKPDDVVVDLGANIGLFSRLALERGAKKVYAFEPSTDTLKCLLHNVDRTKVDMFKACVYSHSGFEQVISTGRTHPMVAVRGVRGTKVKGDTEDHIPDQRSNEMVSCYSMDDLIDCGILPNQIDFLKIDVEGSEIKVFEGLSDENLHNIDRLAIELHYNPLKDGFDVQFANNENLTRRLKSEFPNEKHVYYGRGQKNPWTETITLWRE